MSRITLEQAAAWCGGHLDPRWKGVGFLGANNDTRHLEPGELFVALQGTRDGNDFVEQAMERGAAAALCNRTFSEIPSLVVEDSRKAMGEIARQERLRLNCKVVGITGSVGKTTIKEMTARILSEQYVTGKSQANHNNDIGLPMSILGLAGNTQVAVLEMGMNHFGEMSYLTSIARPDIAVIGNIGTMHMEYLGSRQGILKAKLEILEGLRAGGRIVLNGDEPLLWNLRDTLTPKPLYFGIENPDCDLRAEDVVSQDGKARFTAVYGGEKLSIEIPVEGRHFVMDALAAIAVAKLLEVPGEKIQAALLHYENIDGRQNIFEEKGYTIIKDCYNAGPESMEASLEVLGSKNARRIAVLGDMLELGVSSQAEHYRVGRLAAMHADLIFALGDHAERVVNGAITGGMAPEDVAAFDSMPELVEALKRRAKPGDVILFKGSRGMKMEQALEQFLKGQ